MNKFKVGDRVKCDGEFSFDPSEGIILPNGHVKILKCKNSHHLTFRKSGWCYDNYELTKIGGSMSKYEDLKQRINALDDGWNKKADDVLDEIIENEDRAVGIDIVKYGDSKRDKGDIRIILGRESSLDIMLHRTFKYSSQCTKMTAFKDALLWLLDHSDIKKEDKSELKAEIKELRNKLEKLEERL